MATVARPQPTKSGLFFKLAWLPWPGHNRPRPLPWPAKMKEGEGGPPLTIDFDPYNF